MDQQGKTFNDYWPRFVVIQLVTVALIAFVMVCQFVVLAGQKRQTAEMESHQRQIACLATAEPAGRQRCIR